LSVEAAQDSETLVEVAPLEERLVGAVGGVVSEVVGVAVVVGVVVVGVAVVVVVVAVVVVVVVVVAAVVVVVIVPVAVVPVVVGGGTVVVGVERGTRSVALKSLFMVSGGSTRSTSRIRVARTVMLQRVPGAGLRFVVNVYPDAGEELSENVCRRLTGHARLNDPAVARTDSLKRMESTARADIDTETTLGGASADVDTGTSRVSQDAPPARDAPKPSPSGADSETAMTLQRRCEGSSLTTRPP
jgi:hypothetical protein